MTTKVVTVSIQARVNGNILAVQGATLTLGVNAIPRIELQCAPSNDASYVPLQPTVKKPTISDFADIYRELSEKAEGLNTTGSVSIMLEDNLGNSDSISLNEWILSGVGLSSVSATEAPYLSVILQHPICKLTKFGSIYETPMNVSSVELNSAVESSSNFIEIIEAVYEYYCGLDYWPSPNKLAEKFRYKLKEPEFSPGKYLFFDKRKNGIFLAGEDSDAEDSDAEDSDAEGFDVKKRMAQAMGRFAVPNSGGTSTWDMLMSTSGTLLLSVTQDSDHNFTKEQLVLEPTQPWKKCSLTLREEDCFWTELPGMDTFKISGVMAKKLGTVVGDVTTGVKRNGNAKEKDTGDVVLYTPVDNVTEADGRIMVTNAPPVLVAAFMRDAPHTSDISEGLADMSKEEKDDFNTCIGKYCKAVYEITAASMIRARAQMALWFTDADGNMILPGNTCKFKSGTKEIYYGYVRQVVHHMSTSGGCSTTLAMSYVRPKADFEISGETAIAEGSPNAAYE